MCHFCPKILSENGWIRKTKGDHLTRFIKKKPVKMEVLVEVVVVAVVCVCWSKTDYILRES